MSLNTVILGSLLLSFQIWVSPVQALSIQGIENFHSVSKGVYRGARPTEEGLKSLKAAGIKTVINLQGGDRRWAAFEPGEAEEAIQREEAIVRSRLQMQFFHMPLSSTQEIQIGSQTDRRIKQIIKIMSDPKNQPVFVHCEQGVDRTGLVIALYRVWVEKFSPQRALQEMRAMGHAGFAKNMLTGALDDYLEEVLNN